MIKFSYKVNGEVKEVEFGMYPELIIFVAQNDIKDEDFVSLQMGEDADVINGIGGLKEVAIKQAQAEIDFINAMMAEDEEDFEDGCDECSFGDEDEVDFTFEEDVEDTVEFTFEDDEDTEEYEISFKASKGSEVEFTAC